MPSSNKYSHQHYIAKKKHHDRKIAFLSKNGPFSGAMFILWGVAVELTARMEQNWWTLRSIVSFQAGVVVSSKGGAGCPPDVVRMTHQDPKSSPFDRNISKKKQNQSHPKYIKAFQISSMSIIALFSREFRAAKPPLNVDTSHCKPWLQQEHPSARLTNNYRQPKWWNSLNFCGSGWYN